MKMDIGKDYPDEVWEKIKTLLPPRNRRRSLEDQEWAMGKQ